MLVKLVRPAARARRARPRPRPRLAGSPRPSFSRGREGEGYNRIRLQYIDEIFRFNFSQVAALSVNDHNCRLKPKLI